MPIQSLNPATGLIEKTFPELSESEIKEKLAFSDSVFLDWKKTSFNERAKLFHKLADLLREQKADLAKLITIEMGKPIGSSVAEIEKCAWVCEYYADKGEVFLSPESVEIENAESYISFEPLGVILAVMPWNFPFWQVIRFAAPTIMAGNVGVLKHASNVPQCALAIETIFVEAGFPKGVFQTLLINSDKVNLVISDERIKAVTLTGSNYAGSQVAQQAGKLIKKSVLELGGSDPFIILSDANIPKACEEGVIARLQNAGQSCISAKRFIVVEDRYEEFVENYLNIWKSMTLGDPMDLNTKVGPMQSLKALEEVELQVEKSILKGAKLLIGGKRLNQQGFFYEPTILTEVKKGMPVYDEEVFGPVAAVIKVKNDEEAIFVANDTSFGLGASLWSQNIEKAKDFASKIDSGSVYINTMVKSDPRLPFGGIKASGYGRELSHYGIKEFVNVKTVMIRL